MSEISKDKSETSSFIKEKMKDSDSEKSDKNRKSNINPFIRNTLANNENIKNPFLNTEKVEKQTIKNEKSQKLYYNISTPLPKEEDEIYKLLGIHSVIIKSNQRMI